MLRHTRMHGVGVSEPEGQRERIFLDLFDGLIGKGRLMREYAGGTA